MFKVNIDLLIFNKLFYWLSLTAYEHIGVILYLEVKESHSL